MSEETWQRAQQDSSAPDRGFFQKQVQNLGLDCNLSDRLREHLLECGARTTALLKSVRRYLNGNLINWNIAGTHMAIFRLLKLRI